eukprot:g22272.t1
MYQLYLAPWLSFCLLLTALQPVHSWPSWFNLKPAQSTRAPLSSQPDAKSAINQTKPHFSQRAPYLVAIAGGSGSGKTTLTELLQAQLAAPIQPGLPVLTCRVLSLDSYYLVNKAKGKTWEDTNFDHPSTIDWPLVRAHIQQLSQGQSVQVPIFDFVTHTRTGTKTLEVKGTDVVIVEGLFALLQEDLLGLYDLTVYVDAPESVRLARRIRRDTVERGWTEDEVRKMWRDRVQPMHEQHVASARDRADMYINNVGDLDAFSGELATKVRQGIRQKAREESARKWQGLFKRLGLGGTAMLPERNLLDANQKAVHRLQVLSRGIGN